MIVHLLQCYQFPLFSK